MKAIKKEAREEKGVAGKVWHFLWEDDSAWSWIVSLILAFIIVKFIFFPLLSLTLGSSLPLVVIESSSMHHEGSLFKDITGIAITSNDKLEQWWADGNGGWYKDRNITLQDAETWRYGWGMDKGDIVVVKGTKAENLKLGDVIIFDAGQSNPIIHRIVKIEEQNGTRTFSTKGDNNPGQLPFEQSIKGNQILGKAVLRINKIGWIKLVFVEIYRAILG